MVQAWTEVCGAIRMLSKHWRFSAFSIVVLALGIGANVAIFSVVYAVLIKPLPYKQPEELLLLWMSTAEIERRPFSEAEFLDWKERTDGLLSVAGFRRQRMTQTGHGDPVSLSGLAVSANLLSILGNEAFLGRGFIEGEDRPGATPVALLTYGVWQSRFGSDRRLLGRAIQLDGIPHIAVGILPPSFLFPPPIFSRGSLRQFDAEVFVPLICDPDPTSGPWAVHAVARPHLGVHLQEAQARLPAIAAALVQDRPELYSDGLRADLEPLREQGTVNTRTPLILLMGAVGLTLLIACFNVATLHLARASGRAREIAMRMALGAGRRRIVRQLLVESIVLALLAAGAGVFLAHVGLYSLVRLSAGYLPLLETVSINAPVLTFSLVLALATGIVFGLAPALQISRTELTEALKEGVRGNSGRASRNAIRTTMVVLEVAVAVVLLVGTALLLRSLGQLQRVELGFDASNVAVFELDLPAPKYGVSDQVDFVRRLETVTSLPGIDHAAVITLPPLAPGRIAGPYDLEGQLATTPEEKKARFAYYRQISPDYFSTLSIPVLEGRAFSQQDDSDGPAVCVIDRALADRHWPDGTALGARIVIPSPDSPGAIWARIVGVAGNVKYSDIKSPWSTIYFPLAQQPAAGLHLVTRSAGRPDLSAAAVRQELARLDSALPVNLLTYDAYLHDAQASGRSPAILLGIFAGLALVLALGGLYGVLTYVVGQRRQEIGVRIALGARKMDIARQIGKQTAFMVGLGLTFGLAGAYALSSLMSAMLYEVSPSDPWTFAIIPLLFAAVSAVAAYVPTRRACRVDPVLALRAE